MGIFDSVQNAAEQAAESGKLDQAGEFINEKTGGQYGDQIQQATDAAENHFGSGDGQQQDQQDQSFDSGQEQEFDGEQGQADQSFDGGSEQSYDQGQTQSFDQQEDQEGEQTQF